MEPKEFLESVFESDDTSRQFHFNDIVTALNKLGGKMKAKKPSLPKTFPPPPPPPPLPAPFLAKLLESKQRIPLHPRSAVPHSMSPEDMLKSLILEKLLEADPNNAKRYKKALEKAKEQAGSITLKRIIAKHLKKI